jgi:hypothetical protein
MVCKCLYTIGIQAELIFQEDGRCHIETECTRCFKPLTREKQDRVIVRLVEKGLNA